jgi:hypothetical protein
MELDDLMFPSDLPSFDRRDLAALDEDRDVSSDIGAATALVREGTLVESAAAVVGRLR